LKLDRKPCPVALISAFLSAFPTDASPGAASPQVVAGIGGHRLRAFDVGQRELRQQLVHAFVPRYARLAARAACTRCGRRRAMPGESRCSDCAHTPPKSWPRLIRSRYIETVGGCEFGPYLDELEARADAAMRRIERRLGE